MNRIYEAMVLLDNREVRQGWDALKENVNGLLTKHNAEIISSKLWGERRLAYPINQQLRGTYLLVYFNAPTAEITPINREFNMAEPVLRHVVTVCEEVPESAHEPEPAFDVSKIGQDEPPKEASAEPKPDADAAPADKAKKAEKADKPEKAEKDAAGDDSGAADAAKADDKAAEEDKS